MVLTGWSVGDRLIGALRSEAEISAYYTVGTDKEEAVQLVEKIKELKGVQTASYIDETEAKAQMENMLGNEADILGLFSENPFEAYIDIRINLEDMDLVLTEVGTLEGIDYVRDNRSVLEKIKNITDGLKIFGILVMFAVGITTLIIISHMIRQGIYNNKNQINTLRLLGAPNGFIGFPFVLAGVVLTLLGGGLAAGMIYLLVSRGYGYLGESLPFIPLPSMNEMRDQVCLLILLVSTALGLAGSLFGVSSIRKTD
jgi:cell division transport system permease protein